MDLFKRSGSQEHDAQVQTARRKRRSREVRIATWAITFAVIQTAFTGYGVWNDWNNRRPAKAAIGCTSFVYENGKVSVSPCPGSDFTGQVISSVVFRAQQTDPRLWSRCDLRVRVYKRSRTFPDEHTYSCIGYARTNQSYTQPISTSPLHSVSKVEVWWEGVYNHSPRSSDVFVWNASASQEFERFDAP